jgi:hypothetical protein
VINDLWYKNAVIYCLSVATFMDANGDAGRHRLVMEGYGYRWYRVGGLDYLLDRPMSLSRKTVIETERLIPPKVP